MKPRPRIRKTIKWGGAALTVLLVVVWIGSGWWSVFEGGFPVVFVGRGSLTVIGTPESVNLRAIVDRGRLSPSVFSHREGFSLQWVGGIEYDRWITRIEMPLWPLVAASLLPTALAFRLDTLARRRARMNLCVKCHYDRTGLVASAVCPECGALDEAKQPAEPA